jgi:hypothetical protein
MLPFGRLTAVDTTELNGLFLGVGLTAAVLLLAIAQMRRALVEQDEPDMSAEILAENSRLRRELEKAGHSLRDLRAKHSAAEGEWQSQISQLREQLRQERATIDELTRQLAALGAVRMMIGDPAAPATSHPPV